VKLLSDIYSLIRDIEDSSNKGDDKWVAPTSFERVTTKYWVREEDLDKVLLKSATELPILVYGKAGLLVENPKDPSGSKKDEFWKTMAAPISSVYFDSDNLDLYKERIKRSEGAQLFRVRWYGKKPKMDKVIFLELKTHHECWVANKSVKERVGIVQKRMVSLMDTTDGPWSSDFAKEIVVEASPDASESEIESSAALLLEIRELFCKLQLKPCVRTSYTRVAFQSAKNNNLRLTIDRDITVVDETSVERNKGSWCIEDNDVVPMEAFVKVPYGVFEVKVSGGDDPLFIEELKESDAIVVAPKFSKFLTGASLHNANKVNMLPWWADDELFTPLYNKSKRRSTNFVRNRQVSAKTASSTPIAMEATGATFDAENSEDQEEEIVNAEEGRRSMEQSKEAVKIAGGLFAFNGIRSRFTKNKTDKKATVAPRSPARVEPKVNS